MGNKRRPKMRMPLCRKNIVSLFACLLLMVKKDYDDSQYQKQRNTNFCQLGRKGNIKSRIDTNRWKENFLGFPTDPRIVYSCVFVIFLAFGIRPIQCLRLSHLLAKRYRSTRKNIKYLRIIIIFIEYNISIKRQKRYLFLIQ